MNGKIAVLLFLVVFLLGFSGFIYSQNLALNNRVAALERVSAESAGVSSRPGDPEPSESASLATGGADEVDHDDAGVSEAVKSFIETELAAFNDRLAEGLATRRLLLVNPSGQAQMVFLTDDAGSAVMTINRPDGVPSVVLGASSDRPAILVYNSLGKLSLSFGEDEYRNGRISLWNALERTVVSLRSSEYNDGEVLVGNSNGRNVSRLTTAAPGGAGSLQLLRPDGQRFAELSPTREGHGQLRLFNADRQTHTLISATVAGAASVVLAEATGAARVSLGVAEGGDGTISTVGQNGLETGRLGR